MDEPLHCIVCGHDIQVAPEYILASGPLCAGCAAAATRRLLDALKGRKKKDRNDAS